MALLRERERIVDAGETLAFVGKRAGEEEETAIYFRPQRERAARRFRKASAITPPGASSTKRYLAASRGASLPPLAFFDSLSLVSGIAANTGKPDDRFGLVHRSDRAIECVGPKNKS